jgi:hypothetical protein
LTVSGNKTLAEKISTKERLSKPHFRREAKCRRKPLQTPAEKKEGTESYAKPQNRKKIDEVAENFPQHQLKVTRQ